MNKQQLQILAADFQAERQYIREVERTASRCVTEGVSVAEALNVLDHCTALRARIDHVLREIQIAYDHIIHPPVRTIQ